MSSLLNLRPYFLQEVSNLPTNLVTPPTHLRHRLQRMMPKLKHGIFYFLISFHISLAFVPIITDLSPQQSSSSLKYRPVIAPLMAKDPEKTEESNFALFSKPANILILPFVFLFGLDLIANIAVVTKRSIEVFFTGEYTVWHF